MDPLRDRLLLGFAPLYAPDNDGGSGENKDDTPPAPDPDPVNPHAGGTDDAPTDASDEKPADTKLSAAEIREKAGGLHTKTDGDDDDAKPDDDPNIEGDPDLSAKPEYLPAKFFDAETSEAKVEDLATAYTKLEKAHNKLKGDKKIDAPKEAGEYFAGDEGETFLGDVGKDAPNVPLDGGLEDPGLQVFSEVMHKHNVSKAEALEIAKEVMVGMNDKLLPPIDTQAELDELGKDGQQQVDEINTWADGLFEAGVIAYAEAEMLYNVTATAAGVRLIQKVRRELGERITVPPITPENAEFMSRDDWRAALNRAFEKGDETEAARIQTLGDQLWPDKA